MIDRAHRNIAILVTSLSWIPFSFMNCSGHGFDAAGTVTSASSSSSQTSSGNGVVPTPTPMPTPTGPATVLPAPSTTPISSWVGNSFGDGTTSNLFVQDGVQAAWVYSDGSVFANSIWDEGGHEGGFYKNATPAGFMSNTHGWGRLGGIAISGDDNYIYLGISQNGCEGGNSNKNSYGQPQYPACGTVWYTVHRYDHNGNSAGFSGGYGYDGAMVIINQSTDITGIAAGAGKVFVSDPANNQIKIFTASTMVAAGSFAVTNPGPLVYDSASDSLWIAQQGTGKISHYSSSGSALPQTITVGIATAMAIDANGKLWVADNGVDQNLKIYSSLEASPALSGTFGVTGGQYGSPDGILSPLRLGGPTGVGFDSAGNVYVTTQGTTHIKAFTAAGTSLWDIYCNEFVSSGVIDPSTNGQDVYTENVHYMMDFTKSVGQEATPVNVTQDPFLYPQDPRLNLQSVFSYPVKILYVNGQKLMYQATMYQAGLMAYRFNGGIAVPAAWVSEGTTKNSSGVRFPATQPSSGVWIWRDTNGDGAYQSDEFTSGDDSTGSVFGMSVDDEGTIWVVSNSSYIRKYPMQGLDSYGNPIYTEASSTTYPFPSGYTAVERALYLPETDTMYIGGFINKASDGGCWGSTGSTITRYDGFTSSKMTQKWQISVPFNCASGSRPKAFDVAGNALFVQDGMEGSAPGPGLMRVYDLNTGNQTVSFYPGAAVGAQANTGWTDIPYAVHAYSLHDGTYLVFTEDDVHGKVIMYRWPAP